jgi:hypothetical protein
MAFYCSTMLAMALELAEGDPAYEDIASKFFEHFVAIADAMNRLGAPGSGTRRTGSTTTSCWSAGVGPAEAPLDRRHHPALRRRVHRGGPARQAAGICQAHPLVPREPQGPGLAHLLHGPRRPGPRAAGSSPSRRARASSACSGTSSTRPSSCRPTASARSRAPTGTIRSWCGPTRRDLPGRL